MPIRPIQDRLFARRLKPATMTAGGLFIPESARGKDDKAFEADVVSVGPGKRLGDTLVPMNVRPGDRILVGRYQGQDVEVEGQKLLSLAEGEVLAVVGEGVELEVVGHLVDADPSPGRRR